MNKNEQETKSKYKSLFIFIVGGGMAGFVFHLVWHFWLNINLFAFASHVIIGIASTAIGVAIGLILWYLLNRKSLNNYNIKERRRKHMSECTSCKGPTAGFKCDMCGSESETHVDDHQCGGEHCMPKCQGCNEAQVKCSCS